MSHQNYSLEIISHHPQFNGKTLKKYHLNGIETVGAWGDEPFEIRFKNNTYQKIQVKLSVDGTDILTGQPADTNVSNDMWVVNGYGELNLKAWPEDNRGGATFVFTSATNSVALHTHGDMSNRGIIAAAVFTEGHVEPVRLEPYITCPNITIYPNTTPYYYPNYYPTWYNYTSHYTGGMTGSFGVCNNASNIGQQNNGFDSTYTCSVGGEQFNSATLDNLYSEINDTAPCAASAAGSRIRKEKSLENLVAVGAGSYTDQKITHVAGLIKPIFAETVRVKYLWWDDLVAALRQANVPAPQPSGFPGDHNKHNHINLKGTPRLPVHGSFSRGGCFRPAYEPVYSRV